jgi:threonine dehydrogenase-like Zn-dependent dehydrogenase
VRGSSSAFDLVARAVRCGGTVVEMGNFADSGPTQVTPAEICRRNLRISGVTETRDEEISTAVAVVSSTPIDLSHAVTRVVRWPDLGHLPALFDGTGQFKQMVRFPEGAR